jgi:hypothetical protein
MLWPIHPPPLRSGVMSDRCSVHSAWSQLGFSSLVQPGPMQQISEYLSPPIVQAKPFPLFPLLCWLLLLSFLLATLVGKFARNVTPLRYWWRLLSRVVFHCFCKRKTIMDSWVAGMEELCTTLALARNRHCCPCLHASRLCGWMLGVGGSAHCGPSEHPCRGPRRAPAGCSAVCSRRWVVVILADRGGGQRQY